MSSEQADSAGVDVDTRSDVFAGHGAVSVAGGHAAAGFSSRARQCDVADYHKVGSRTDSALLTPPRRSPPSVAMHPRVAPVRR